GRLGSGERKRLSLNKFLVRMWKWKKSLLRNLAPPSQPIKVSKEDAQDFFFLSWLDRGNSNGSDTNGLVVEQFTLFAFFRKCYFNLDDLVFDLVLDSTSRFPAVKDGIPTSARALWRPLDFYGGTINYWGSIVVRVALLWQTTMAIQAFADVNLGK
ncbi:hypothetical protein HAX54_005144, partial [Datura stramonium]|nr:hypothetical protein [Datura stramonium]